MAAPVEIYCGLMEDLKVRVGFVRDLISGHVGLPFRELVDEAVALQLRKILEIIAFGSLSANLTEYSGVRQNFHREWRLFALPHRPGGAEFDVVAALPWRQILARLAR